MKTLRGGNGWKAAGVLFLLAGFLGVMLLVPTLRKAPAAGVDVPAMSNAP
jgi:predicted cobalt transporter CbtA